MPRTSLDPKQRRITVRLSENDLAVLEAAATRLGVSIGAALRQLIRNYSAQSTV